MLAMLTEQNKGIRVSSNASETQASLYEGDTIYFLRLTLNFKVKDMLKVKSKHNIGRAILDFLNVGNASEHIEAIINEIYHIFYIQR